VILHQREVPPLAELVEKHVKQIANRREEIRAGRVLRTLCATLPSGIKVTEILTTHLQTYVDLRKGDGLKPSSINRELNIVSSALRAAHMYYPSLTSWATPKLPRPRQSKRRRERIITADEVVKVLTWLYAPRRKDETKSRAANRRNVGNVFRMALLTGARKGELCKLRWDYVDWGVMVLQIVGTKTEHSSEQTVRYLKITDTIAEILRERLAATKGAYVFTLAGGEVTDYYDILREACGACGVVYGRQLDGGFVTHDARHTAVTRMLQSGRDLATIGSITGHTDKTLILHYGHATTESRDKAMDVLENFAGNETLGLGLDTVRGKVPFSQGMRKRLVPEVGLEPT
jgi:integrase